MSTNSAAAKTTASQNRLRSDYGASYAPARSKRQKLQRHFIRLWRPHSGRCWKDAMPPARTAPSNRIAQHLSPRGTASSRSANSSDREDRPVVLQRFAPYLPARGEFTLFNRSWYNRAGVETG